MWIRVFTPCGHPGAISKAMHFLCKLPILSPTAGCSRIALTGERSSQETESSSPVSTKPMRELSKRPGLESREQLAGRNSQAEEAQPAYR